MRSVVLGRSTSRGVPGGQPGYFSTGWFLFSLFQKRSSVLKNSFVPFCESYSETENPLYGCFGAVLVLVWACSGPSIGPTPTFSTGSIVFETRRLYSPSCREGFFSETRLAVNDVLGTLQSPLSSVRHPCIGPATSDNRDRLAMILM